MEGTNVKFISKNCGETMDIKSKYSYYSILVGKLNTLRS